MTPDDAVLLCSTALTSVGEQGHAYPVGGEWARLRRWYPSTITGTNPVVSKHETEHWLLLLAEHIRGSNLSTAPRVQCLQAINTAIVTVRTHPALLVTRHDLWRWTQIVSWAKTAGIIHTASHDTTFDASVLTLGAHQKGGWRTRNGMFTLAASGGYRFVCGEIAATSRLLHLKPDRLIANDAYEVFREWISTVSGGLGVPTPSLTWDKEAGRYGGGYYEPFMMRIASNVVSETVLLHEYRHHLQHLGAVMPHPDPEIDAQAWAEALLAKATG